MLLAGRGKAPLACVNQLRPGAGIDQAGVLMRVAGLGVLLAGTSGVGKSEVALALLSRGHVLVADDLVVVHRTCDNRLVGICPAPLKDFLEVRGLGVLDARAMFGPDAVCGSSPLQMVIRLEPMGPEQVCQVDHLVGLRDTIRLVGVAVPRLILPVVPGRDLAILVESAVCDHRLRLAGYDAAARLQARIREQMG